MIIGLHSNPKNGTIEKPSDEWLEVRKQNYDAHIKHLIKSERVTQAGPLHICTEKKNDPDSLPIGDLIIFNAKNRTHAIEFAESDPLAQCGIYQTLKVIRFNDIDVSGKFHAENEINKITGRQEISQQMKIAMERGGYPVDDEQTTWINR